MNNLKKKIKYLTTCLLSALIVLSSFGCTVVVHSCSVSGNSNICINKINEENPCNACCDEKSGKEMAAISDNCCTEHSFSTYFYAEVNQTINNAISFNAVVMPSDFYQHAPLSCFFKTSILASQTWSLHQSLISYTTTLLQSICKLQI